jgi:hypothetical protein
MESAHREHKHLQGRLIGSFADNHDARVAYERTHGAPHRHREERRLHVVVPQQHATTAGW